MFPIIRLARDSDADKIASLVALYWEFEGIAGFDRPLITALLVDFFRQPQHGRCWVAEEGGQLIGYLLSVYVFSLEHGGMMAEIDEFFVVHEKRSSKIGSALLSEACSAMQRDGLQRLQLQLGIKNTLGKRFYEQHGFRPISGYSIWHKPLNAP